MKLQELKSTKRYFILQILLTFLLTGTSHADTQANRATEKNKKEILTKAYSLQIPFIENKGQITNQKVKYYAKTMGGTVFVEENGVLTYSLPVKDNKGVVIKEIFTEKKIKLIETVTKKNIRKIVNA
ncbi:MAG: hypothetical protein JRJ00_08025 [Deltaproteobacteria bacterium]|nr:hypothetical protein [Deltaproteobacteria bacterium]